MWEAIAASLMIGLLGWAFKLARDAWDRRLVYRWLRVHTRDEPGESHVSICEIAKGTRLSEDRVLRACMTDRRVLRSSPQADEWSVWREAKQSVYEKRGIIVLGD